MEESTPNSIFNNNQKRKIQLNSRKNSCYVLSNGSFIKLMAIENSTIMGKEFANVRSLFKQPLSSRMLGVYKSEGLSSRLIITLHFPCNAQRHKISPKIIFSRQSFGISVFSSQHCQKMLGFSNEKGMLHSIVNAQ